MTRWPAAAFVLLISCGAGRTDELAPLVREHCGRLLVAMTTDAAEFKATGRWLPDADYATTSQINTVLDHAYWCGRVRRGQEIPALQQEFRVVATQLALVAGGADEASRRQAGELIDRMVELFRRINAYPLVGR